MTYNEALIREASAILAAAAKRDPVDLVRLQVFAIACVRGSVVWRLAHKVQQGGEFAPRRALELAEHILASASQGRPLPPRGFYFCPVCVLDRRLSEPCEHIKATEGARAELAEFMRRIDAGDDPERG